jgi:uncharacterized membrane protein HdeD (DUF308 family)
VPTDPGLDPRNDPRADPRVAAAVGRITGNWWALALRAIAAIIIGVFALTRPGITVIALVTLFGVYAMADGLFAIVAAIRGIHARERWGWMMFEGIVGLIVGIVALTNPAIGALALTWLVAGWALSTGVLEIIAGIRLRKIMTGEWLLLVAGILSVILAFLIISRPRLGIVLLVSWVGAYALISGIVLLGVAFRVRSWTKAHA